MCMSLCLFHSGKWELEHDHLNGETFFFLLFIFYHRVFPQIEMGRGMNILQIDGEFQGLIF